MDNKVSFDGCAGYNLHVLDMRLNYGVSEATAAP